MLRRFYAYTREMFPLHIMIPGSVLVFASVYLLGLATLEASLPHWNGALVAGFATYLLSLLLLRLMDDIKDFEVDKALFKYRPTAQKAITKRDLYIWMITVLLVLVGLNLRQAPVVQGVFAVYLVYALFMFKYFFYPPMAQSLVLAVVTHNPIVPLGQLYILSFALAPLGISAWRAELVLIVLLFWFPFLAWEISRKIRAPKDETAYETYSRILGYRGACGLLLTVLVLDLALAAYFFARLSLHPIAGVIFLLAWLYPAVAIIRFMLRPTSRPVGFKPEIEIYITLMGLAFTAALALRAGGIA